MTNGQLSISLVQVFLHAQTPYGTCILTESLETSVLFVFQFSRKLLLTFKFFFYNLSLWIPSWQTAISTSILFNANINHWTYFSILDGMWNTDHLESLIIWLSKGAGCRGLCLLETSHPVDLLATPSSLTFVLVLVLSHTLKCSGLTPSSVLRDLSRLR